jgi:hypothetical protein
MKKLNFCILVFAPIAALAQVPLSKGTIFVGGTLSTSFQNTNSQTPTVTNSISVQPNAGYFLSSKLAVGFGIGYDGNWSTYSPSYSGGIAQKTTSNLLSFVPAVRYYIPISPSVFFVPKGQISVGFGNSTGSTFDQLTGVLSETQASVLNASVGVTPTFIFFLSSNWGIEAAFGALTFSHNKSTEKNSSSGPTTTNTFVFNAGQISLGLSYYFYKKK